MGWGTRREGGWASEKLYVFRKGGVSGAYLAYFRSHSSLVQDGFFLFSDLARQPMGTNEGRVGKVNYTLPSVCQVKDYSHTRL